jgi:hypothetical protein
MISPVSFKKLSVLMPVFNERWTLRAIVEQVLGSPVSLDIELIVVDDCSTDGSWELIQELAASDARIKAVRHEKNGGKGTAVRTAIGHMTGDVAVVQDADLEYDPREFPALLAPILEGKADAVFGSRYAAALRRVDGFWHTQANRFLTLISNLLTGLDLTDMETCYKAVRADMLRQLRLTSATFTIEPELTSRLAQFGARIYEAPISYAGRTVQEGKKIRPIDGVKAIATMLRCRFIDRQCSRHQDLETLRICDRARTCQAWIQRHIAPFVGRRVLHLECGLGSVSGAFLSKERVILAQRDPTCAEVLQRRFLRRENLTVEVAGIEDDLAHQRWKQQRLDTVILLDWLAREASCQNLDRCREVLTPGGCLVMLAPGAIGPDLAARLAGKGFEIALVKDLGRVPQWLALRWKGPRQPDLGRAINWLNRLLPVVKWTDRWLTGPAMIQLVVARRPAGAVQRRAA